MSKWEDVIILLKSTGGLVGEYNADYSSNSSSVDWDVAKHTKAIGYIGGNTIDAKNMTIYRKGPWVQNSDIISGINYIYNPTKNTVRFAYNDAKVNPLLEKGQMTVDRNGFIIFTLEDGGITFQFHENSVPCIVNGVPSEGHEPVDIYVHEVDTYIGQYPDDGSARHSIIYSVCYYQEFNIDEQPGIPFYCWAAVENPYKIYVGVNLKLKSGNLYYANNVTGWLPIYNDAYPDKFFGLTINSTDGSSTINTIELPEEKDGEVIRNATHEWENTVNGYDELLYAAESESQAKYWTQLYGEYNGGYSLKSHRSIIGLPLQFMSNVDMRVGSSTYGKQFMEDILYDMNIACIKPGGPVLNPHMDEESQYSDTFLDKTIRSIGKWSAYFDSIKDNGVGESLKQYLFSLFKGGSARFYSFQSDYTHYTHYVNTLCHLFITYLNIGEKEYINSSGTKKKYAFEIIELAKKYKDVLANYELYDPTPDRKIYAFNVRFDYRVKSHKAGIEYYRMLEIFPV